MDDDTVVFVWSDSIRAFVPTEARLLTCPECGADYGDVDELGEPMFWWDEDGTGRPFLQCDCGEQFYTWED